MVRARSFKHRGEWFARDSDGTYIHVEWSDAWVRRVSNDDGVTGFCRVIQSVPATWEVDSYWKLHKCAFNPCTRIHTDSKHGKWGPSTHVQPVTKEEYVKAITPPEPVPDPVPIPEPEPVPEPVPDPVPEPVPESVPEPVPDPVPEPTVGPAAGPTAGPDPVPEPAAGPSTGPSAGLPSLPTSAPLKSGVGVPSAIDIDPEPLSLAAPVLGHGSDVADPKVAKVCIFKAIMKLSREISESKSYVGYSFFVLLALSRKCPLLMFEGESCVNLLEAFAPWALDTVTSFPAAHGIVTALVSLDSGKTALHHVCEAYPLDCCRHFIACKTMDVILMVSCGSWFYGGGGAQLLN